MILAEQGKNEGMQHGMRHGMQQGELKGKRALLERLLSKRFGLIPSAFLKKLENASEELLLEWSDRIIEAKTLHDVFETQH